MQNEYHGLVVKCMDFACELMDLCRGTQEVEAVLSEGTDSVEGAVDLLARLKMAIRYQEKKVGITLLHCTYVVCLCSVRNGRIYTSFVLILLSF